MRNASILIMERELLYGFARAFHAAMRVEEHHALDDLFEKCPTPGTMAFDHWRADVFTAFAEISRQVISEILEDYQEAERIEQ